MKIRIVTPAPPRSRKGNRVTALRWARVLRDLGHQVVIEQEYHGRPCDLLIALHARRSAAAVQEFRRRHSHKPLIVALTGTDLYRDIRQSADAKQSLELASRLVVLQPLGVVELPEHLRPKARVIYQSVRKPRRQPAPRQGVFGVCVLGHLRTVKDPFRAALAARRLPASSRVRVIHLGAALSPSMEKRARAEMAGNPRYCWLGEVPRSKALHLLARCRLLVLSSVMEGGANAISEALVVSVPVLASRIPGSVGLLGPDYPGYFPVRDTAALAALLRRAECDAGFYRALARWCKRLAPRFEPARERRSWQDLLREFMAKET